MRNPFRGSRRKKSIPVFEVMRYVRPGSRF